MVLILGFLQLAAKWFDQVFGTNTQEECSLQCWCLMGLRTESTTELLRPWAAFLGAHGWDPIRSAPSSV